MTNDKMEILAPAGDEEMLRAAVFSGADCVYLGLSGFNARRGAQNFSGDALRQAVQFCHARGCGVHVAINTLVFPGKEEEMFRAVYQAANAGCDAIIAQDLAVLAAAKRIAPHLPLHASTQMSVHSLAGVRQLAQWGYTRCILARELNEQEIADIARQSPIQLEVFVHGALCVSVSGQCYASAFLGGRSANRGGCAGTCRLPFCVVGADGEGFAAKTPLSEKEECHHLSLKDLSVLDALPLLKKMGVSSAKIEGRLRGPEYTAVCVDAARKSLNKEEYDKELLQNVFSRSGFTDGWFTGINDGSMFGVRTPQDAAAARAALPKARQLYRRERPRVPVQMKLCLSGDGGSLLASDGENRVEAPVPGPLPAAEKDGADTLQAALAKTGGTPFYLQTPPEVETAGVFFAAPQASALRRQALEQLLRLRGEARTTPLPEKIEYAAALREVCNAQVEVGPDAPPALCEEPGQKAGPTPGQKPHPQNHAGRPLLRARFAQVQQMPQNAAEEADALLLPLRQWQQVPKALRHKTWLWLPRVAFGQMEARLAQWIQDTREEGFAGYEIQNIAHLQLCAGLPTSAGFGLNITNPIAAHLLLRQCQTVSLSMELSLVQMRDLLDAGGVPPQRTDAFCYGYLPLMITRACPVKQVAGCAECGGEAALADRKGKRFALLCDGDVRSIHNPVPLWMGDRLKALPTGHATAYFTHETRAEAQQVWQALQRGEAAPGAFTRGLYSRGTEE